MINRQQNCKDNAVYKSTPHAKKIFAKFCAIKPNLRVFILALLLCVFLLTGLFMILFRGTDNGEIENIKITTSIPPSYNITAGQIVNTFSNYFRDNYGVDIYPENYGGCYGNGLNLVILVTDNSTQDQIIQQYGLNKLSENTVKNIIQIKQVEYSLNYLKQIEASTRLFFNDAGFEKVTSGIDEELNHVRFSFYQEDYQQAITLISESDIFRELPIFINNSNMSKSEPSIILE